MNATSRVAGVALDVSSNLKLLRPVRVQLVFDAAAALLVLLAATILSVYKPWGLTGFGRRKLHERSSGGEAQSDYQTTGTPWDLYILIGVVVLVLAFIVLHFAKGGLGQHGH